MTGGSSEGTDGNGDGTPWQCRQRRAFGSEARVLLSRGSSVACPWTRCRPTGPLLGALCGGTACPPSRGSVNGHGAWLSPWRLPAPRGAVGDSAPGGRAPSRQANGLAGDTRYTRKETVLNGRRELKPSRPGTGRGPSTGAPGARPSRLAPRQGRRQGLFLQKCGLSQCSSFLCCF